MVTKIKLNNAISKIEQRGHEVFIYGRDNPQYTMNGVYMTESDLLKMALGCPFCGGELEKPYPKEWRNEGPLQCNNCTGAEQ